MHKSGGWTTHAPPLVCALSHHSIPSSAQVLASPCMSQLLISEELLTHRKWKALQGFWWVSPQGNCHRDVLNPNSDLFNIYFGHLRFCHWPIEELSSIQEMAGKHKCKYSQSVTGLNILKAFHFFSWKLHGYALCQMVAMRSAQLCSVHISAHPKAASFVEGKHRWSDVKLVILFHKRTANSSDVPRCFILETRQQGKGWSDAAVCGCGVHFPAHLQGSVLTRWKRWNQWDFWLKHPPSLLLSPFLSSPFWARSCDPHSARLKKQTLLWGLKDVAQC